MAIENRDLAVGTRLLARYKRITYHATVVRGVIKDGVYVTVTEDSESNNLGYRLDDGRGFKSLSAAGSAIMDGTACNGWRFWNVDNETKPETTEQPKVESETDSNPQETQESEAGIKPEATTKPKGRRKAKAEVIPTPTIDCHCGTYEEGTESCKWRESGDCLEV